MFNKNWIHYRHMKSDPIMEIVQHILDYNSTRLVTAAVIVYQQSILNIFFYCFNE